MAAEVLRYELVVRVAVTLIFLVLELTPEMNLRIESPGQTRDETV